MRLISCYIQGFGRITDFSYQFDQGLNTMLHENGWGKTTFAVFIKSMFYGMDYSARKKTLTEREHYMPWNGGVYGGSLSIQVGDRKYRIERTFGKKDKEDTFRLIDLDTMMESEDYTANIGEEIFAVDKDSFEKSIFVPENSLNTTMTDSMNARMGQDAEKTRDDVTRFDEAVQRVDNAIKDYKRNSKTNTGRLILLRQEIREQQELVDKIPVTQDAIRKIEALLRDKRKNLYITDRKKRVVAQQIIEQSKREQTLGEYRAKKQQLAEAEEDFKRLDDFFANGLPAPERMEEVVESDHQLSVREKELEELEARLPKEEYVEDLKELFHDDIPTVGQFDIWDQQAQRLKDLRMQRDYAKMSKEDRDQLTELNFYFAKKKPTTDELKLISNEVSVLTKLDGQVDESAKNRDLKRQQLEIQKKDEKEGSQWGRLTLSLVLTTILGFGAVTFAILATSGRTSWILPISMAVMAVLVFGTGVTNHIHSRRVLRMQLVEAQEEYDEAVKKQENYLRQQQASKKIIEGFLQNFLVNPTDSLQQMVASVQRKLDTYERLQEQESKAIESSSGAVEELATASMELFTVLQPYADKYEMQLFREDDEGVEMVLLQRLREDAETYRGYLQQLGATEDLREKVYGWQQNMNDLLSLYPTQEASRHERLSEIRRNLDHYDDAVNKVKGLREEVADYEAREQVSEESVSVEELQEQQKELEEQSAELQQMIHSEKEELSARMEELEAYEEAQDTIKVLKEQEAEMQYKVEILEDTKKYLQKAREQFLGRYMGPLQRGMRHYLGMLAGSDVARSELNFTLDMDLNPKVVYHGSTKDGDYLSAGYQDLLSLCSRFALIDVLYQKEKPMVILDDPFSNLDQNKVNTALELVKQVAEDRQVIYFTCHNSRI